MQPLRQSGRGRLPLATDLSRQRYFIFKCSVFTSSLRYNIAWQFFTLVSLPVYSGSAYHSVCSSLLCRLGNILNTALKERQDLPRRSEGCHLSISCCMQPRWPKAKKNRTPFRKGPHRFQNVFWPPWGNPNQNPTGN